MMKAADLDKRRKLLLLLWRGLRIRRQRPSFTAESGLLVCQVQARSSIGASARLPGVFIEVCEAEQVACGIECASYRGGGSWNVLSRSFLNRTSLTLTVTRVAVGYAVEGERQGGEGSKIFEVAANYGEARRSAIRWLRGELLSGAERRAAGADADESMSFTPGRARIALRWLAATDRVRLLGRDEAGAEEGE